MWHREPQILIHVFLNYSIHCHRIKTVVLVFSLFIYFCLQSLNLMSLLVLDGRVPLISNKRPGSVLTQLFFHTCPQSPVATAPRPPRNGSRAGDPSLEPGAPLPHRTLPPGKPFLFPAIPNPPHQYCCAGLTSSPRALAGGEGVCGVSGARIQAFLSRLLEVRMADKFVPLRWFPRGSVAPGGL